MVKLKTLLISSLALLATNFANAQEITIDGTAAIVNSDIILTSELDAEQRDINARFKAQNINIDPISARKAALEQLISRSLVMQMAKRQGIDLTDLQLDQALYQAANQANISVETLLKQIAPGSSESKARERFKNELIFNELKRSQVRNRVHVSQTDVNLLAENLKKAQFNEVEPQYHIAQLIVPLSATATLAQIDAANATINNIKAQLKEGANFNNLAARYTQGSLAAQGGDLGFLRESQIPIPFLPSLLKAKAGDVIGPFRSGYGLHLIKLIDVSTEVIEPIKLYNASHILLTTSVVFSDEAAQKNLQNLRQAILDGKISFADAATKYSEDTGSAIKGGNLGYASADIYDPAFARTLVSMKVGQISQPIKSNFGWHLIYLKDTKIDKGSDKAYKDKAYNLIYQRLFNEEAENWERELRSSAYIHVIDPILVDAHVVSDETPESN